MAALAGPTAYTLSTVSSAHTGSIPTAGPAGASMMGGGPGGGGRGGFGGGTGGPGGQTRNGNGTTQGQGGQGQGFPGGGTGGTGGFGGGMPGQNGNTQGNGTTQNQQGGMPGGAMGDGGGMGGGGGVGGLLNGATVSAEAKKLVKADADDYTWAAAAIGAQNAASYQLATDESVMAIGGFNGTDPSPTASPVQGVRGGRKDPLLHLRRLRRRHGRQQQRYVLADHLVGRGQLQEGDGRFGHLLRPHPEGERLT